MEFDGAEAGGAAEDGEAVPGVGPEGRVGGEGEEGVEEGAGIRLGVLGGEGGFELADQIFIADGVLLVFGMVAVGGEVKGEAGAGLGRKEFVQLGWRNGDVHIGWFEGIFAIEGPLGERDSIE